MNNISANRKRFWVVGIVLAALYFSPTVIRMFHRVGAATTTSATTTPAKPSPILPNCCPVQMQQQTAANGTGQPGASSDQNDPSFPKFIGVWNGAAALPRRGVCQLHVDVQDSHDKAHPITAYSTISCVPTMAELLSQAAERKRNPAGAIANMTKNMAPVSSILSGTLQDGVVTLEPKKTFGVAQVDGGCPVSSFTLTPFSENMAAEWKENGQDVCQGGQAMMQRAAR